MRTMPPEHFKDFRDATGDSSAIQLAELSVDGSLFPRDEPLEESGHFSETPHLKFLISCAHPLFLAPRHRAGQAERKRSMPARRFSLRRELLDRQLLSWRGAHLFFAKVYLADIPVGTGGTSGAPYLQKSPERRPFFRHALRRSLSRGIVSRISERSSRQRACLPAGLLRLDAPLLDSRHNGKAESRSLSPAFRSKEACRSISASWWPVIFVGMLLARRPSKPRARRRR